MTIKSRNEWGRLRSIIVGSATGAAWPDDDPVYKQESMYTQWKDTPPGQGSVPQWIVDESNEDLQKLVDILQTLDVIVYRPQDNDFCRSKGMYNYCPRDRLLIADDQIVDVAMMYPSRDQEIQYLSHCLGDAEIIHMPRDQGLVFDAANVSRLNDDWLFLRSRSGNDRAYNWLKQTFPKKRIHLCDFYSGVHIDSTIVPLREGVVLLNAARVKPDNLPPLLTNWHKIWVRDCVPQEFYQYPYSSKWIGMNCLSVDPNTVIVDAAQTEIIKQLERDRFTVIPHTLRHSRTLGGGGHCVTLDLWRDDD